MLSQSEARLWDDAMATMRRSHFGLPPRRGFPENNTSSARRRRGSRPDLLHDRGGPATMDARARAVRSATSRAPSPEHSTTSWHHRDVPRHASIPDICSESSTTGVRSSDVFVEVRHLWRRWCHPSVCSATLHCFRAAVSPPAAPRKENCLPVAAAP